jgi:hypothetical protein
VKVETREGFGSSSFGMKALQTTPIRGNEVLDFVGFAEE